jgi:hypothetical protein
MQQLPGAFPIAMRAAATLDQQMLSARRSGRSPFWERSSRAPPDPEDSPGE